MFSTNEWLPFWLTFHPTKWGHEGGVLLGTQPDFPAPSHEHVKTSGATLLKPQGV